MPGVATATLLSYAPVVDVDMDSTNDVNFADVEDYGHRVMIELGKSPFNLYFNWQRLAGSARPSAKLNAAAESAFRTELIAALNAQFAGYVDIDGVTGGLHFGSANMSTNTDPRIRKDGAISANDLPMAFVLYKLYGNSAVATKDNIFNLQDAHEMLSSETVADAIIASFKAAEGGALDSMFRDLLASDPHRFFDANGISDGALFETNTDVQGGGNWKLVEDDIIEVKTKFVFKSKVSRRGVAGREHNLSNSENASGAQENQQTVINPDDYFYVRLQMKVVSGVITADASKLVYQSGSGNTKIVGYTGALTGQLTIPSGVTEISANAFTGQTGLTAVIFPSTLTTIGDYAFKNCTGLTSVTTPSSVTWIGREAFRSCTNITSVTVNGATRLRSLCFRDCTAMATITMPNVIRIDDEAFFNCDALTTLTIPNSCTQVEQSIANNSQNLTTLTVGTGITSIPNWFISQCPNLDTINLPSTITTIGGNAFRELPKLASITIPNSVTTMGDGAFFESGLVSFTFPTGVTVVNSGILQNCNKLTSVTLHSGITEIRDNSFSGTKITSITGTNVTTVGFRPFGWCSELVTATFPVVTSYGGACFRNCPKLTTVSFPSSLTSIGADIFIECFQLNNVAIPSGVTSIPNHAFFNCPALLNITIPASVTSIGEQAFRYGRFSSISLPGVLSIGALAFADNTNVTTITAPVVTSIGANAFQNCPLLTTFPSV